MSHQTPYLRDSTYSSQKFMAHLPKLIIYKIQSYISHEEDLSKFPQLETAKAMLSNHNKINLRVKKTYTKSTQKM